MTKEKDMGNLTCVGAIIDAYHMQGMVKIKTFTAKPENIGKLKCLDEKGSPVIVEATSKVGVFRIKGINDRTEAEAMIGTKIYVQREDLPKIDSEEEFYMEDMAGMIALDMKGNQIGIVKGCYNFGAGDILEISFTDGKEEMYLFTRENFPEVSREFVKLAQ